MLAHINPQAYHTQPNHIRLLSYAPCKHWCRGKSRTGSMLRMQPRSCCAGPATSDDLSQSFSVAHGIIHRSVQRSQHFGEWSRIIVEGLAVLRGILPHYNVFVEASTPLGEALQVMYGKALEFNDAGAVRESEIVQKDYSQQITSNEALASLLHQRRIQSLVARHLPRVALLHYFTNGPRVVQLEHLAIHDVEGLAVGCAGLNEYVVVGCLGY